MKDHRQSMVLATKYSNAAPGTDPNAAGNQRKNMMQAVEASLRRLQTDYIDLYWVHIWDQITPVEEVMRGLDDLVRQGKVLYVGISDAAAWWIAQANTLAKLRGWSSFTGLQVKYSLVELQDNLASFNLTLSAEQVNALDEASQIDLGFPYNLYAKELVRAIMYGGMRDQILA